ncbi:M23 family metallopeptidase [Parasphingopyxis marina]|uniref:M23 family metallopeptidase n=1 Tax=Parasphingopyxis marina TaxID=2761622 RepID=A0A842HV65_9SPHN|nr:M23 family metallopeptidase [Parasphingopyxis marina]MBC2776129.1 M23 family metallopeptidase [Parasphingopyxis marina]
MKRSLGILAFVAAVLACSPAVPAAEATDTGARADEVPGATASVARRTGFHFDGIFRQGGVVRGEVPGGTRQLTLDGEAVAVAADGHFLIAFGRDHGSDAILVATLHDGTSVTEALSIAPTSWRIEHVNAAPRGGSSSAEFRRRRAPELERINAARAVRSQVDGWRQAFLWPVTGRISGLFGSQRIYRGEPGSYHSGVDIARPAGTPIVAPADGVVILAAQTPFTLEGYLLMIDHGMGLNSAFLHLSRIDVAEGDRVARGDRIGAIGSSGRATGPHLHWSMKWGTERIDPRFLAGPMPDPGS